MSRNNICLAAARRLRGRTHVCLIRALLTLGQFAAAGEGAGVLFAQREGKFVHAQKMQF